MTKLVAVRPLHAVWLLNRNHHGHHGHPQSQYNDLEYSILVIWVDALPLSWSAMLLWYLGTFCQCFLDDGSSSLWPFPWLFSLQLALIGTINMHCGTACPHPLIFFGQSKVVDSFGTADAKAAEIKTNTSSGEVTILKLAPLSDTSGNSTSTDFQAVEVGSGCPSHMMAHVGLTNDSRLKETFSNQIRCAGLYSAGRNVCAASKFAAGQCRSLADQGRRK